MRAPRLLLPSLVGLAPLLGGAAPPPQVAGSGPDLGAAWGELGAADAATRASGWNALVAAGAPAALQALAGWDGQDVPARRLRARLVERVGDATAIPAALARAEDPDPEVRRILARFLGRAALGEEAAAGRVALLARLAGGDPDPEVRQDALTGLERSDLSGAAAALAGLVLSLPPAERGAAAKALLALPGGRGQALELVQRATRGELALDAGTRAVLLEGYGRLLAEVPGGGTQPAGAAPLLVGRASADPALRKAALAGFDALVARLDDLGDDARTDAVLAAFGGWGWNPREILYRRAYLALRRGALDEARARAGELLAAAREGQDPDEWTWRFYGLHFTAVADFAAERFGPAATGFEAAQDLMRRVLQEREDLRPDVPQGRLDEGYPRAPVAAAIAVDRIELVALEELWRALALLAQDPGSDAAPPRPALEALRAAHVALLQAQAFAYHGDLDQGGPSTWDVLLERDLGPRALLFTNERLPGWGGARALDLALVLGRGLATVTPDEVPGFRPFPGLEPRLTDPFADDERFALLRQTEAEELSSAQRGYLSWRLGSDADQGDPAILDPPPTYERLRLAVLQQRLHERADREAAGAPAPGKRGTTPEQLAKPGNVPQPGEHTGSAVDQSAAAVRRDVYRELLGYRSPTIFALTLSGDLREEGRVDRAESLARAMLDALGRGVPGVSSYWTEWTSARLEMSVASSKMDANHPADAETVLLSAVSRLENLQHSLEERAHKKDGTDPGTLQSWIEETRSMLSNALLSLAVNANVRMDDQERARGYFERAYDLEKNDFMRVLLACYRARSGHLDEARAVLRSVEPTPQLWYNLACTYALLGDTDQALDYLQRELEENHPTPGSREHQKEWARSDPDLKALRDLPRFQRLVAPQ